MSGYRAAGEAIYEMARGVVQPAFILTACLLAIGIFMLNSSDRIGSVLFMAPFTLGPLFFSLVLALFARRIACQIALIIGSVLYAAWFYYLFNDIVSSRDAQGGLALFLIGILSLPVMCGVWSLALYFMFSEKQPPDKQDDELANLIVAEEVESCPSDE